MTVQTVPPPAARPRPVLAIVGGTGALGSALALRWAAAGYVLVLGSRSRDKAVAAAAALRTPATPAITGDDNAGAARAGDIVVISVPYASHEAALDEIAQAVQGKIVLDACVPLMPPKVALVHIPIEVSAGQWAQHRLGAGVRVVSAFHNVGAAKLRAAGPIECDVLVFGDDRQARAAIGALVAAAGARAIDGGPIANSVAAEALTAVLIGIIRRYKIDNAGIRITGLPEPFAAA